MERFRDIPTPESVQLEIEGTQAVIESGKKTVLALIENFEVLWTKTPLNGMRRKEGLPETTPEQVGVRIKNFALYLASRRPLEP